MRHLQRSPAQSLAFYATSLRRRDESLQSLGLEADTRRMSRRLTFTLLFSRVSRAAPATAIGQAPVDERADARAFADIALPAAADFAATIERVGRRLDASRRVSSERRLARELHQAPRAASPSSTRSQIAHAIGELSRILDPSFTRALSATRRDPDRRSGPAGRPVRRGTASAGLRAHRHAPARRACAGSRALVRSGFRLTPAMRGPTRAVPPACRDTPRDRPRRASDQAPRSPSASRPPRPTSSTAGDGRASATAARGQRRASSPPSASLRAAS